MKIFYIPSKTAKLFKGRNFLYFFLTVIFATLVTSQLVSHIKNISEPAASQTMAQSIFTVTLDVSGALPQEKPMIVVNGEDYAPLISKSSLVELERPSVIEIFCDSDADFSVSVRPSVGTTVVMSDDKKACKKGMNYICRCFFSD